MPIKGLTDRGLSFPEIGQIRKGAPKPERGPGKDLQYFRVTFDEREQEAAQIFVDRYGTEPNEINIILPFNDIEQCWDAWLEAYTAGRMVARSDGERFVYLVDTKTGEVLVKNGEPYTPHRDLVGTYRNRKTGKEEPINCKPTGRLKVIIPELARAAYLTVLTTSVHDIGNISAQLEAFKKINNGRISGIPLVLRRRPKKISMPTSDGGRSRATKWMLSIEADPQWVKGMLMETKRLALPGNGLALLPEQAGGHDEQPEPEDEITGQYTEVGDDEGDEMIPSTPEMGDEEPPMEDVQQTEQPERPITKAEYWNRVKTFGWDGPKAKEFAAQFNDDYADALAAAIDLQKIV
jgi:hypothetical protein